MARTIADNTVDDLVALAQVARDSVCRPVGVRAEDEGLRGVRCRSAPSPEGAGRDLAWFPATGRSHATERRRQAFTDWFWN